MQLRPILRGLRTYASRRPDRKGTGGTDSARYCYSIWLRHLVQARIAGMDSRPKTVAELGPGDSLGTGIAALLTGAESYEALDVVEHANPATNYQVFEELIRLISRRESIPGPDEFPRAYPRLESYDFPRQILSDERLRAALEPGRVQVIRDCLTDPGSDRADAILPSIRYRVPWHDPAVIREGSVDWLFSQATLEHVEDLDLAYAAMRRWLVIGGVTTHEIDFKSHDTSRHWNGHWEYPDAIWRLVKGRRSFLLNREPLSFHLDRLRTHGFEVLRLVRDERSDGLPRERLARRYRDLSDSDSVTSSAFIVAVRKA